MSGALNETRGASHSGARAAAGAVFPHPTSAAPFSQESRRERTAPASRDQRLGASYPADVVGLFPSVSAEPGGATNLAAGASASAVPFPEGGRRAPAKGGVRFFTNREMRIIRDAIINNRPVREVAAEIGRTPVQICQFGKRQRRLDPTFPKRRVGGQSTGRKRKPVDVEAVIRLRAEGLTYEAIAQRVGSSEMVCWRICNGARP